MINAIIYSKDRAYQLHLLLQSIQYNAPGIFNINVLFKYSNDEFKKGYEKLQSEITSIKINWVLETDFRAQNIELTQSEHEFTCYFTDDDIIYNTVDEKTIIDTMQQDEEVFCFSLRLGKNTLKCYTMQANNVLVPLSEDDKIVKWNWTKHYLDFGYPLSVDGHIFHTEDIATLCRKVPYTNPNTFEASLQAFDYYPKEKMASFLRSKLVNSPNNMVQDTFTNNINGVSVGISPMELNKKFLNNLFFNFLEMKDDEIFNNIESCHQEINIIKLHPTKEAVNDK